MADEPLLLSELCNICNANPPKYRCPRCSSRTCSLACSKRHKTRAGCSGVRDPAAYLKRSELATPQAIDHDYNFLAGLERTLDRGRADVDARLSADGQRAERRRHAEKVLEERVREAGVLWRRAPEGMSRRRANATRVSKGKPRRIIWSVEWVYEGAKELDEVPEDRTVAEAWENWIGRKGRKRKLAQDEGPEDHDGERVKKMAAGAEAVAASDQQPQQPSAAQAQVQAHDQAAPSPSGTGTAADVTASTAAGASTPAPASSISSAPIEAIPTASEAATINPSSVSHPRRQYTIYLHRPGTAAGLAGHRPVLIPIPDPSHTTLAALLRGRLVLELPTLYVFDRNDGAAKEEEKEEERSALPPSPLEGFLLEAEYEALEAAKREEMEGLARELGVAEMALARERGGEGVEGERDGEEKVQEVLKGLVEGVRRDLGGGSDGV